MMLGYMLARAGVPVAVLEKHEDFLRDFRGDTVHPSTLVILGELGLGAQFEKLPQRRVNHLGVRIGGQLQQLVDFRGLRPFPYLSLVPQWDFLNLLAEEGRKRYPHFDLRMRHEAIGLIEDAGRVTGVRFSAPGGCDAVHADVVVACDGRHSTLRQSAGLKAIDFDAPMDVLWFRLPRRDADSEDTFGILGNNHLMVMLNRTDYWQIAYVVPKGSARRLREQPVDGFRHSVARLAPFLADRVQGLSNWDEIKTLEVRVDRLERWYRPGFLVIGDAAHAMSPIGGVGINLAVQDAVAAANALAPALRSNRSIDTATLRAVQVRRMLPTRLIQFAQVQAQNRVISKTLDRSHAPRVPAWLRWLLGYRLVRNIPAWLIGYGVRQEHVAIGEGKPRLTGQ